MVPDRARINRMLHYYPEPLRRAEYYRDPLHYTVTSVDVVELLFRDEADPAAKKERNTSLHMAAAAGDVALAERLLSSGASPNERNESGDTPLHLAAYAGHVEVAELLLKHGADPNIRNRHDMTPLHEAVLGNKPAVAALLLKHGADPNIKDALGNTPLELAEMLERHSIAAMLKSAPAASSKLKA